MNKQREIFEKRIVSLCAECGVELATVWNGEIVAIFRDSPQAIWMKHVSPEGIDYGEAPYLFSLTESVEQ